ncbi:hypothetical protein SteCoe_14209 [Stentor coeruleus]|uniref:Uncharacterized protein n=1 Tax=Stentor coeruleus TaxID=5963 RepID=A0A1R2C6I1_9CILI|nr:hypothetical protein SteCoe_14209 [Stentor coeruleus]
MSEADTATYKIIIIGDGSVGKTSLVMRIVDNQFSYSMPMTIGVDNYSRVLQINSTTKINLSIWDTAGQERFSVVAPSYFRGSKAAIIVYDITREESFKKAEYWAKQIIEYGATDIKVMLIGNKLDLDDRRKVLKKIAFDYARCNNMMFFETSCLNATNVETAFVSLAKELHHADEKSEYTVNCPEEMKEKGKNITLDHKTDKVVKKKKRFC